MTDSDLARAVAALAAAKSALFITGAGLSADSGLPTYRGIGGLYNDVETVEGMPIEVALSGHMMNTRPALCWKYIAQVEAAGRGAKPNAGHEVIAKLETRLDRVLVLTQNVDGLHRAAGSGDVIDIHGDIRTLYCTRCQFREVRADFRDLEIPPRCPKCDGLVRPDVVLFGEMLDRGNVARLTAEVTRGFDVVFSVGTSSLFPYIASPFADAAARGCPTIEINPAKTDVSALASLRLEAGAADALAAIWKALEAG